MEQLLQPPGPSTPEQKREAFIDCAVAHMKYIFVCKVGVDASTFDTAQTKKDIQACPPAALDKIMATMSPGRFAMTSIQGACALVDIQDDFGIGGRT